MQKTKGLTRTVKVMPAWVCDETAEPVTAVFIYRSDEPHAVSVLFAAPTGSTTWTFARTLLKDGCARPTGEGEVRVSPDAGHVAINLNSVEGSAHILCRSEDINQFLETSYETVPDGQESMDLDWDAWANQLSEQGK